MDTIDPYFETTPDYSPKRLEFTLPFLSALTADDLVIDVGCGTGTALTWTSENTHLTNLVGVDPSPASLEVASNRVSMTAVEGSILDESVISPYEGKTSAVLMAAVLHHIVGNTRRESIANVEAALDNVARLLSPEGRLLLFEPCYGPRPLMGTVFWIKRAGIAASVPPRALPGPDWVNPGPPLVSYLTPDQLGEMLSTRFDIVEQHHLSSRRLGGVIQKTGLGYVLAAR